MRVRKVFDCDSNMTLTQRRFQQCDKSSVCKAGKSASAATLVSPSQCDKSSVCKAGKSASAATLVSPSQCDKSSVCKAGNRAIHETTSTLHTFHCQARLRSNAASE
jgi:hypothetical protein